MTTPVTDALTLKPQGEDLIAHLMTVQGSLTEANGETPSTSPSLPAAET